MGCSVSPKIIRTPIHRDGTTNEEEAQRQEVVDYETALDAAGYGRFSIGALGACALAFFTTGVENCVMSYVLPAARCELELTTYEVGLINMAFMCGGVASAFFWGIAGDVFGRRRTLSLTLVLNGLLTLAQSTVSDYSFLLAARSISGFLIGGPSTLVLTYLSDLVGVKRRQLYLSITGMCFVAAWLVLPALAWIVIPFKTTSAPTLLPIYSWRLYLALNSFPGFIAGIWILTLPESPRLLLDTNRNDKALKLVARIHRINYGKTKEFKIKKLLDNNVCPAAKLDDSSETRIKILFLGVLKDLKLFVSRSYALKSSLILFVFFANMAAGFGLNLYIPEMLLRMQSKECKYAALNVLNENQKIYKTFNKTWSELNRIEDYSRPESLALSNENVSDSFNNRTTHRCDPDLGTDVFTSGLIVGACCVVGNALCSLMMSRSAGAGRGVRSGAAACAGACAASCACLAACACACATTNKVAVAAAALLNAASLNGNVLLIRLLLLALPPKLSGLGVCWGAWWGRAGGVASNIAVGALLDFSCPAPFIAVGVLLVVSIGGIMMIKLQRNEEVAQEEGNVAEDDSPEKNRTLDRYSYISTYM